MSKAMQKGQFKVVLIFLLLVTSTLQVVQHEENDVLESITISRNSALPSSLTFSAITCSYEIMHDVQGDVNNAALDIVGNSTYPAVQTASNATDLFVKIRLDESPANSAGTSLQSFMWGIEFDTDGNLSTYENLVSLYGTGQSDDLSIYNNTVTSTADSPMDSAEDLSVTLTPTSDYWNVTTADSSFATTQDYFLTIILPWDQLTAHGVNRTGPPSVNWFGTSTNDKNLNGDFACHDGDNETITLSSTGSDPVPLEAAQRLLYPNADTSTSPVKYYLNATVNQAESFTPTSFPANATYTIHPSAPAGLTINSSTGEIHGTPTTSASASDYTVYANSTVDGVNYSAQAIVVITVTGGGITSLTPSHTSVTLTKGTAMTDITMSTTGGTPTSWSISPSLPNGITFDIGTGTISGTPSVIDTAGTNYTVTASNSAGSITATVEIIINDVAPSGLTPSHTSVTLTKGTAMTDITMTASGGAITSWAISPALVAGLSFDSLTGTISGTPTVIDTSGTTYTITAGNSGGSTTATVTIYVNDAAPSSVTASQTSVILTKGIAMTDITMSSSGGSVTGWAISPSLPSGLSFDTSTGTISGTPTVLDTTGTTYRVTGSNSAGSAYVDVTITIIDQASSITASQTSVILTKGIAMTDITMSTSGGAVTSWAISPSLPAGLSFSTSTGTISGTPTVLDTTGTTYQVTGSNSAGPAYVNVTITIIDQASSISASQTSVILTKGIAMTDITMSTSGGAVTSWAISPSLPAGLSFSTSTGTISGTPTVLDTTGTTYQVTGSNSAGPAYVNVTITIIDQAPSSITPSHTAVTLTKGTAMTDITMSNSGGAVTSWAISPALAAGLSFDTATGTISGTPTVLDETGTIYTVTATNSGGSAQATVTITIIDVAPNGVTPSATEVTLTKGTAMTDITMSSSGGAVTYWTISPVLPAGLSFDDTTGTISGTPTVLDLVGTTYTVTAANSGGQATGTVKITIIDVPVSNLDCESYEFTFYNGTAIADIEFTADGGAITSWSISPALVAGLNFDSATGTISGTPTTVDLAGTSYEVTASNSGGSDNISVKITVLDAPIDSVTASETYVLLTRGVEMNQITLASTGGPVTSWSYSPELPAGLSFDEASLTISGTPTVNMTRSSFTFTASNSAGSATVTVDIEIQEPAPELEVTESSDSITIEDSTVFLSNGSAWIDLGNNGGAIESWNIVWTDLVALNYSGEPIGEAMTGASIDEEGRITLGDVQSTGFLQMWQLDVTVENQAGESSQTLYFVVGDLTEFPSNMYHFNGQEGVEIDDWNAGVESNSYFQIIGELPAGLSLDPYNGTISGTPDADYDGHQVTLRTYSDLNPELFNWDTAELEAELYGLYTDETILTFSYEADTDRDGVIDEEDDLPEDPTETKDTDGDGTGDNADEDDDGDGWSDEDEESCSTASLEVGSVPADFDGDGICDALDQDDDNDGSPDTVDEYPLDETEQSDMDGDGIGDNSDPDKDGDGKNNQADQSDGDEGIINHDFTYLRFLITCMALLFIFKLMPVNKKEE